MKKLLPLALLFLSGCVSYPAHSQAYYGYSQQGYVQPCQYPQGCVQVQQQYIAPPIVQYPQQYGYIAPNIGINLGGFGYGGYGGWGGHRGFGGWGGHEGWGRR